MNINFKTTVSFVLLLVSAFNLSAQNNLVNFSYKKGEVLDILLLTARPNSEKLFERYKQTAFPVAFKYSYQPQPGFAIKNNLKGADHGDLFVFGKWDSLEKREGFLEAIVPAVPDFHQQRKDNFSRFVLTYWELQTDINFTIDRSKYNVISSFWGKGKSFNAIIKKLQSQLKHTGGKQIITLKNGKSPEGYVYNPDILFVTQWESQADFEVFQKAIKEVSLKSIKNTHQFVLK